MIRALHPQKLRRSFTISERSWNQIRQRSQTKFFIGQQRAREAFEFGIGNKAAGFNIYVSGYPGSGKARAINHFLEERAKLEPTPGDWCYVNNFKDPYCPRRLQLDRGGASVFQEEMDKLIDEARAALVKAFESKEYGDKRQHIIDTFKNRERNLFNEINELAKANKFVISRTPIEIHVVPVDDQGKPISDKEFASFSKERRTKMIGIRDQIMDKVKTLLRKNRELERERQDVLVAMDKGVALYSIELLLDELQEKYAKNQDVLDHLEEIKNHIIDNLGTFLNARTQGGNLMGTPARRSNDYKVNILTDNTELQGAPIITEFNPTYHNLFGKVEHESHMGTLATDFTLIRGGSLHLANGGYLIIPLKELLMNYFSYDCLKRALKNGEVVIEDASERFGFLSVKSLKPDPIPLKVQIILIGTPRLYHLLYRWDEDFKELFKVKAEFDTSMPNSASNARDFATVIHKIVQENQLLPLNNQAVERMLELACRLAEDQERISIRFREMSNMLFEASHYAQLEQSGEIGRKHVERAVECKYYRSNLLQEKVNEMIRRNALMIDLDGEKIGQINGISVLDLGDIRFGRPNRITVNVSCGKEGLIDIEREVKLGGPIHSKGVLILNGYLSEKYGQDKAISLMASLVFEQSYGEIEGDSASSAELYALLSALAKVPIRQGIAVTGSVNQKGEVQPIGAINEKIEGYFEVCKQQGLTAEQGVIVPDGNKDNLMLKEEVIQAVSQGNFNIWAVRSIDQGLEILTGLKAGKPLKSGGFSKGSVHQLVDERIHTLNENLDRAPRKRKK